MIPLDHLRRRRAQLLERIENPALLFAGGRRARANPFSHYPYRADSNFLLFFADPEPGSAALFDPGDGTVTLFLPERTSEAALWEGRAGDFSAVQQAAGVDAVLGAGRLEEHVHRLARGRPVGSVAVADSRATERARRITGLPLDLDDPERIGPPELVAALAELRLRKADPEVEEIRRAVEVTAAGFARAMAATRPGTSEQDLAGLLHGEYERRGCTPGYGTVLTVRGEILHNEEHRRRLAPGDLLLVDSGAERPSGYGADVTRTWPAEGAFEGPRRDVYEIVLRAQEAALAAVRPGARWRDVHRRSAEVLAEGLVDLGLLRGAPAELVHRGAHAIFFPHGVGHFLGLDTHDLRAFGDRILYPGGRKRSEQFGADALRMDHDLEPGMVVTVEPGLYFVPAILHRSQFRRLFRDAVDFERAESYLESNGGRGFGGVRIEDDLLVTASGHENLTRAIPKRPGELEAAVGRRADPPGGAAV